MNEVTHTSNPHRFSLIILPFTEVGHHFIDLIPKDIGVIAWWI